MYVGNNDWTFLHSEDSGVHVARRDPPQQAKVAFAVAVDSRDAAPSDVFIGIGDPDTNVQGEVLWSSDPATTGWTQLNLVAYTAVTCAGNIPMRPIGLAVGRDATGLQNTYVVAAVDNCGMWRGVSTVPFNPNSIAWTQTALPSLILGDQMGIVQAPVVWPDWPGTGNDNFVYIIDRAAKKLWRSQDFGATWDAAELWPVPGAALTADTGYLAADPSTLGRLWATTNQVAGTWLLTNAHGTLGTQQFTGTSAPKNPGPVAVRPGSDDVYIAGRVNAAGDQAELWRSLMLGSNWTKLGTSFYRSSSLFPTRLSVSGTPGLAYESMAGQGVTVTNQI